MAPGLAVEADEEDGGEFRFRLIYVLRLLDVFDSEEGAHEGSVFLLSPQCYYRLALHSHAPLLLLSRRFI